MHYKISAFTRRKIIISSTNRTKYLTLAKLCMAQSEMIEKYIIYFADIISSSIYYKYQ